MKRIDVTKWGAGLDRTRPANRAQSLDRHDWFRITNANNDTATVVIYDEIGYWGTTAADFTQQLRALDVSQIEVRINTPGGDVYDGVAIYNALMDHPADITTVCDGMAASIGSIIMQAGKVRLMNRATEMMIHLPFTGAVGNAEDMRKAADLLDQVGTDLASVYADRAGGSPEMWLSAMRAETWYSADEAVRAGLATAVQGKAPDTATDRFQYSVFNYAGRAAAPPPPVLENYDPAALRRAIKEAMQ